jgi:hypothetical protein
VSQIEAKLENLSFDEVPINFICFQIATRLFWRWLIKHVNHSDIWSSDFYLRYSTATGALWSFTNMAGSVAHNLEALSLDNEHSKRALNARRSARNKGLAHGVQSGLSEFGISLLGTVSQHLCFRSPLWKNKRSSLFSFPTFKEWEMWISTKESLGMLIVGIVEACCQYIFFFFVPLLYLVRFSCEIASKLGLFSKHQLLNNWLWLRNRQNTSNISTKGSGSLPLYAGTNWILSSIRKPR